MKHLRFSALVVIFLSARAYDITITNNIIQGNLTTELNPLTLISGMTWNLLVAINIFASLIVIYLAFCYEYKYKVENPSENVRSLNEYLSLRYFNKKNSLYKILYSFNVNKNAITGHGGYALIRGLTLGSILAGTYNIISSQGYDWYDSLLSKIGDTYYFLYATIFIVVLIFYYSIVSREYKKHVNHT